MDNPRLQSHFSTTHSLLIFYAQFIQWHLMNRACLMVKAHSVVPGSPLLGMEKSVENATLQALSMLLAQARERVAARANTTKALACAMRHLASVERSIQKPFRIALLGEPNSGKSSIANGIIGKALLPILPIPNTRLPTRLYYTQRPQMYALTSAGKVVSLSKQTPLTEEFVRLDIGLPVPLLRDIEVIDFPGLQSSPARRQRATPGPAAFDGAIWATVATQAWRESERSKWVSLPARIRRHGLLAITNIDLIHSSGDFRSVESRISPVAKEHFAALCFLPHLRPGAVQANDPLAIKSDHTPDIGYPALISEIRRIASSFEQEKLNKAIALTRRIAHAALSALQRT
jgi:Dynamin family